MTEVFDDKYNKPSQTKGFLSNLKTSSRQFFNKKVYITGFISFLCLRTFDYFCTDILKIDDNSNETMINEALEQSVIFTVYACLVGPIIEELIFRKFIFGKIRKHSRVTAYIVSSFLFAVLHFLINIKEIFGETFPIYFIMGLILAVSYDYNSSILSPIIGHVSHNSSLILFYKML